MLRDLEWVLAEAKQEQEEVDASLAVLEYDRKQPEGSEWWKVDTVAQLQSIAEGLLDALGTLESPFPAQAPAPYRGAYGYAPVVESQADRNFVGYMSPHSLMLEIMQNQLRAKVEGVILEDAWLLDDSIRIGELKQVWFVCFFRAVSSS